VCAGFGDSAAGPLQLARVPDIVLVAEGVELGIAGGARDELTENLFEPPARAIDYLEAALVHSDAVLSRICRVPSVDRSSEAKTSMQRAFCNAIA